MNVDVGRGRKRTGNVHRSEVIRERIEDHLMRSGGKHSRDRYIAIRQDFVSDALRTAQRLGIRSWKGADTGRARYNAEHSLATLFGEIGVNSRGPGGKGTVPRTGVNAGWVLDIWEATLDHITREGTAERERERQEEIDRGARDEPVFDDEPEEESGPRLVAVGRAAPTGMRVIEAFLNRDEEAIMRIAVELEAQENRP